MDQGAQGGGEDREERRKLPDLERDEPEAFTRDLRRRSSRRRPRRTRSLLLVGGAAKEAAAKTKQAAAADRFGVALVVDATRLLTAAEKIEARLG